MAEPVSAIIEYLSSQHVLSLCTRDDNGLWCASCFYVFDAEGMHCYLMTGDGSRHTQAMEKTPQVAGTIAGQPRTIAKIQGIQFTALASRVTPERQAAIRQLYCAHFPVAKLKSAPLWQLQLQTVKMTDNLLGFGSKHHWQRPEA
ncbi:YhbP family protein [Shewanella sp. YIC-542]|uniref:YhbP family protein n=1 Tax=Shewanella mytili TaxID=3377111 RepID=UPI00398E557E